MDDEIFKSTVIKMASGEMELDMDSIYVFFLFLVDLQYHDRKQEMREALASDSDIDTDQDDNDMFVVRDRSSSSHRKVTKEEYSDDCYVDKGEYHARERKGPRLLLDDALIMV